MFEVLNETTTEIRTCVVHTVWSVDHLLVFTSFTAVSEFLVDCLFLQEQERRKMQEYENYLKEKLQVDEVVKKIYEEDKR